MAHQTDGLTGPHTVPVGRSLLRLSRWVRAAAPGLTRQVATLAVLYIFATLASLVSLAAVLTAMGVGRGRVDAIGNAVRTPLSGLSETQVLMLVLLAYIVTMVVAAGARFAISVGASRLREDCLIKLRKDVFASLLQSRWQVQATISDADGFRILTEDAGRIAVLVESTVQTIVALALLACMFLAGLVLAPVATLITLGIGGVIVLALLPIRRQANRAGEDLVHAVEVFHRLTASSIQRRKEIRAHDGVARTIEAFSAGVYRVSDVHHRVRHIQARSVLGFDVGLEIAVVLLVATLALNQDQSGNLFLLLYCFMRGLQALRTAHSSWSSVLTGLPSFARAYDVSRQLDRVRIPVANPAQPETSAEPAAVQLENVSVTYDGQQNAAIEDVCLTIEPGELVALIGPSGSGKTTLVDVCAGIIAPDQGERHVRSGAGPAKIGYVGQAASLYPMTIRENLTLSAPLASDEDCWNALKAADAGFVARLPEGLETHVGLTRSRFSGGEEKRILLACALVRDPSLLVLDETTSQLDADSQAAILDTLVRLRGTTTIILITHSTDILAVCDRVYTIRAGRLQEPAAHDEAAG